LLIIRECLRTLSLLRDTANFSTGFQRFGIQKSHVEKKVLIRALEMCKKEMLFFWEKWEFTKAVLVNVLERQAA
jgi:hypothetical protein